MKILEQFKVNIPTDIPTDTVGKLAVLKKMCHEHTISKGCSHCPAKFEDGTFALCSLRRQDPDVARCCDAPARWYVPNISTEYSENSIKFIIFWFRDLMIYHPDRFKNLREYISGWGVY